MSAVRSMASWLLLGIFLMPSPRILDHDRTHRRHATCEHHLRRHHPDPVDRARVLRRAERRDRRIQEARMLIEQERARVAVADPRPTAANPDADDDAAQVAAALDESNLQPCQAAADPQDGDSSMKKGKRTGKIKTQFWSLQEPPRIRTAGEFLAMLRTQLEPDRAPAAGFPDVLPHYGSGPCHSIPRPREGTILPSLSPPGVVVL